MGTVESWNWKRRIARAQELAHADRTASALLTQYASLLAAQRTCYDAMLAVGPRLIGSLDRDLDELRPRAATVFEAIASVAPAEAMRDAPPDAGSIDLLLRDGWRTASMPFLARVVLQPYAEALSFIAGSEDPAYTCRDVICDNVRLERGLERSSGRAACPFCGGPPQVAALRSDSVDGGGRALVCGTCSTNWSVRRILCPQCGEEDERRLGYFEAADFPHVRVDACDTCRHYVKTVDLTKLGLAVPLVDDVAAAALDIWAQERGYTKVTPNLIGL